MEETKPVEPESCLLTYTDLVERPSDFEDIDSLRRQLSKNPEKVIPLDRAYVLETFGGRPYVLVRRTKNERRIIAMSELVVVDKAFESFGLVEEVVTLEPYRRRGIAKEMLWKILQRAAQMKLGHVDLTSAPERVEANQLYTVLGFQRRETNMYRMTIPRDIQTE